MRPESVSRFFSTLLSVYDIYKFTVLQPFLFVAVLEAQSLLFVRRARGEF